MFSTRRIIKKPLSEENILAKVSDYDIFKYYIGDFKIGTTFSSPLHGDTHPSFGVFVGKNDGKLMFNDYVVGGGSCFVFVMKLFNADYWTSLNIINNDMKLGLKASSNVSRVQKKYEPSTMKPSRKQIIMAIKIRKWNSSDKLYWKDNYNISGKTLQKYNVYPISHYYINGMAIETGPCAYAYHLAKGTYKIYQPNVARDEGKFFTNVSVSTPWQGSKQLPKKGELLFITSSLKDVMVLDELEFYSMAPHTEHQIFTDRIYNFYKERWKEIVIFYDHDKAGLDHAKRWEEKFGLKYITTQSDLAKDPSDYGKFHSLYNLKKVINEQL